MKAVIIIEFYFLVINSLCHKSHFLLDDNAIASSLRVSWAVLALRSIFNIDVSSMLLSSTTWDVVKSVIKKSDVTLHFK